MLRHLLRWSPSRSLAVALWLGIAGLGATGQAAAAELLVSAAASLTNVFKDIGVAFEKIQANTKVTFNFAASGPLLAQIERGAPVDVFATADQETMDKATEKGLIVPASRADFTANQLALIVPVDSKLGIRRARDLVQPDVKRIAIGNPVTVPVGRYAQQVLRKLELWDMLQSKFVNADSVRQVLDYVIRGEVDAGFVYVTDALVAKGKVTPVVDLNLETDKPIRYPIAVVASSTQVDLAAAFIRFVQGPEGRTILQTYGFSPP
jgi:molybdate transport system substrate-binding protein